MAQDPYVTLTLGQIVGYAAGLITFFLAIMGFFVRRTIFQEIDQLKEGKQDKTMCEQIRAPACGRGTSKPHPGEVCAGMDEANPILSEPAVSGVELEGRNMDQEQYLEGTPLGRIILRGIKKLVTEMTSTKFLLLVFICIGTWQKFIQDSIGLGTSHHRDPGGPGRCHYREAYRRSEMKILELWLSDGKIANPAMTMGYNNGH